jgi:K+-sensing histidine kinase KdpD
MVSDTGCGVPKEKAETIFANFAKLNEFVPGIGLGLSLCRSMVKLLGGSIELDTEYTEGCRFVVTLQPLG